MRVLLAMLLLLMVSACETQVAEPEPEPQQATATEQQQQTMVVASVDSFCDALSGQTWQSVDQLEAGRSVNGVAKMHWKLGFENGQFRWRYSDVVEMGTYTCDAEAVSLISSMKDPRATGSFNAELSELVINNVRYVLQTE